MIAATVENALCDLQVIESNVSDRPQNICNHALFCRTVCPNQVQKDVGEDGDRSKYCDDPQVRIGVVHRFVVCTQHAAYGAKKRQHQYRIDHAKDESAIEADGRGLTSTLAVIATQRQRDYYAAAGAKQRAEAGENGEHRSPQTNGCNHIRIA